MEYIWHYESPLGGITLAASPSAITGLWFDKQKYYADTLDEEHEEKLTSVLKDAVRWLDIYFAAKAPDFVPALSMKTTQFRKRVWEIMLTIPYGETMTYSQIAGIIANERGLSRMSAQAVGNAVAHNSISLIIPCHRVVGCGGCLTGYAGGIEKKARLLELEGADMDRLYVPGAKTALKGRQL